MGVVDVIASEYGWTKDYILDHVYPDEAVELTRRIKNRVNSEYLVQIAIVSNPWTKNPKKLVEEIESRIDKETELGDEDIPDHAAIQRLKNKLARSSKLVRVK